MACCTVTWRALRQHPDLAPAAMAAWEWDTPRRRNCAYRVRPFFQLMGRAAGPEPVAVLRERRVVAALQDLQDRLLDQAIQHDGDAGLALPAVRLGIPTRGTGCGRYIPLSSSY